MDADHPGNLESFARCFTAIVTDSVDSERQEALKLALQKAGITSASKRVTKTDISSQDIFSRELSNGTYHAVVFDLSISTIDALSDAGFFKKSRWPPAVLSFAGEALIALNRAFLGKVLGFTAVVPNPDADIMPLTLELQKNAERFSQPYAVNFEGMESYINTKVCVEALRRVSGAMSPQRVGQAMRAMRNYDLGGISASFSNTGQDGLSWLVIGLKAANGNYVK